MTLTLEKQLTTKCKEVGDVYQKLKSLHVLKMPLMAFQKFELREPLKEKRRVLMDGDFPSGENISKLTEDST